MAVSANVSSRFFTVLNENDGVPGSKFDSEPENYTVEQLKRWLKCRGLKLSGKRDDIVARVKACIASKNHFILDPSIDEGKWLESKHAKETTTANDVGKPIRKVPEVPKSGWKPFPSIDIPGQFNYGHVHFYMLESLPFLTDEDDENKENGLGHMTDKPFTNGRKYIQSGFVHNIVNNKVNDFYFVRAHVWPSMRSDYPHNVDVILSSKSGAVVHATCDPCKVSQLGRCSHVAAVLLTLSDYVKENGHVVSTPCTSKDCSWDKGKKRGKTPKRVSDTNYSSKRKKSAIRPIDFDPRPVKYRRVSETHINNFLRNINIDNVDTGKTSMWAAQLSVTYHDYSIKDVDLRLLIAKRNIRLKNMSPASLAEIEDTSGQSQNENWQRQRWFRLTASKCLDALGVAKSVVSGANEAEAKCKKFISSNIWHLDPQYQSAWMTYGLESEPLAISKYQDQTQQHVEQSGLWVNPKFPFLACSPDGLVGKDGLVEIKSLKIFEEHSIDSVLTSSSVVTKDVLQRQCFVIRENKLHLRRSHSYYYQVQMQLLVTERKFCDFILYAKDGPVSIERVERNESVIAEILENLTALWERVIGPELIEMRVPRDLKPFILPGGSSHSDYTQSGSTFGLSQSTVLPSTAPPISTISPTTCTAIPGSTLGSVQSTAPPISTINPTTSTSIPGSTLGSVQSTSPPISTFGHRVPSRCTNNMNLVSIPWGGITSHGLTLVNTCPLDNWMMILQSLVKLDKINLHRFDKGNDIKTALDLVELGHFGDAKLTLLSTPPIVTSNVLDLYGNESDYYMPLFSSVLQSEVTTTCNQPSCPLPQITYKTCNNILSYSLSNQNYSIENSLSEWLNPGVSTCQRKFISKPNTGILYSEHTTIDINGTQSPSWHCDGKRASTSRQFCNLQNVYIFNVDLASRAGKLTFDNLPAAITLSSQILLLHSVTLWNGSHYICILKHNDVWLLYDGMKEYRIPTSGISSYKSTPHGYILSHVLYAK